MPKPAQTQERVFSPGPRNRTVKAADGSIVEVPLGWDLLLPGDATLTKRVKAAGDYWLVQKKVRRKLFSCGIWAQSETIQRLKEALDAERATEKFAEQKEKQTKYREKVQERYVDEFFEAVCAYLAFHPSHATTAEAIAYAVTNHATPVGSGTVARTKRISIEERAEAAVIAWMRHATTDYDTMKIARIKGNRRNVRRDLAKQSIRLLDRYRTAAAPAPDCPLVRALDRARSRTL